MAASNETVRQVVDVLRDEGLSQEQIVRIAGRLLHDVEGNVIGRSRLAHPTSPSAARYARPLWPSRGLEDSELTLGARYGVRTSPVHPERATAAELGVELDPSSSVRETFLRLAVHVGVTRANSGG